ncbi:MAG: SAM-dependent methyltransferase [Caldilineaceae bacterium]
MSKLVLTANPDFADLALAEVDAAGVTSLVMEMLEPGVYLLDVAESFWDLAEQWCTRPPIFVRHICPVQLTVPLAKIAADLPQLSDAVRAEFGELLEPQLSFSVQSRTFCELPYKRFDINNNLAATLQEATGAPLDVRAPAQILSVVCAEVEVDGAHEGAQAVALVGLSLASHNLSDWAGGMRRFAREAEQVSRAEFKLLEALEVFQIALSPRGVALDLGAAPGGWTRVLRRLDQYVTAVDPAELDPRVKADRSVRHKRITAEAYLADEPDTFDIIVNDIRMDARDSARLMVAYAKQLYADGLALVTLKLPEQNRRAILDEALEILQQQYDIRGARQLFHNRSEVTVYLTPRE